MLAALALGALLVGCDGRNLGAEDPDANVDVDARPPVDSQVLDPCESWDHADCEEQPGCTVIYYGGGCFDMGQCDPEGSNPGDELCYGQGFACVPTGGECNDLGQWECDGECVWVRHDFELCHELCCIDEGYGYCISGGL